MDEDFNLLFSYIGTILNDIKHRVTRVFPFPDAERGYTKLSSRRIRCKNGKCSKYGISLAKKNLGAQWPEVKRSIDLPATCTTVVRGCSNNILSQRRWLQ